MFTFQNPDVKMLDIASKKLEYSSQVIAEFTKEPEFAVEYSKVNSDLILQRIHFQDPDVQFNTLKVFF